MFHIQTTETNVITKTVWENESKKKFVAVAFLQPDETHFATLDDQNTLQIFYLKTKEQVLKIVSFYNAFKICI